MIFGLKVPAKNVDLELQSLRVSTKTITNPHFQHKKKTRWLVL